MLTFVSQIIQLTEKNTDVYKAINTLRKTLASKTSNIASLLSGAYLYFLADVKITRKENLSEQGTQQHGISNTD